jgi:large subunit ribosomal protein L23
MKSIHRIIKNPRVTEKAVRASSNSTYTFDVERDATKTEIMKSIKEIYKVNPVKVGIIYIKPKKIVRKGIKGVKKGGKKAVVTLKKGETINIY